MAINSSPTPPGATGVSTKGTKNLQIVRHGKMTWINIERPTRDEIEWLRQNYHFHPLHLDDCLSKIQRPKIDEHEDYLFIVLHFPVFNKMEMVTVASEVDIFVGQDYVVTVHSGDLKPLHRMFVQCQSDPAIRQELMGKGSGTLLHRIVDRLVDHCFPILNKIDANLEAVEDTIFEENVRQTVRDISMIRRDIINFRRIIKPQISVIASLQHKRRPFLHGGSGGVLRGHRRPRREDLGYPGGLQGGGGGAGRHQRLPHLPPAERGDQDPDHHLGGHAAADAGVGYLRHERHSCRSRTTRWRSCR